MAEEVAVFTKEKAELILDVIDYLVKAGYVIKSGQKGELLESIPRVYFQNNSGETIPAYGVMQVNGNSGRYVSVTKPTTTGVAWLINSHREIENGDYGIAQTLPVMHALGEIGVGLGSYFLPTDGSWELTQSALGEGGCWAQVGTGQFSGTVAITPALGFNVRWSDALTGWSIDKTANGLSWVEVVGTDECA